MKTRIEFKNLVLVYGSSFLREKVTAWKLDCVCVSVRVCVCVCVCVGGGWSTPSPIGTLNINRSRDMMSRKWVLRAVSGQNAGKMTPRTIHSFYYFFFVFVARNPFLWLRVDKMRPKIFGDQIFDFCLFWSFMGPHVAKIANCGTNRSINGQKGKSQNLVPNFFWPNFVYP